MKIVLTGASSFSGLWFARTLSAAGHEVVMPLRGASPQAYAGLRAKRVAELSAAGRIVWGMEFGSDPFLAWLQSASGIELFCHHASVVSGHQSSAFDVAEAVRQNMRQFPALVALLKAGGCQGIVFTGTYYEADEGVGSMPRLAFSPYACSKTLSYEVARKHSEAAGLALGKFVMPNPFGPLEEKGFTFALRQKWLAREPMSVRTPDYVRDNIHADLLALAYEAFCRRVLAGAEPFPKASPSGYAESQGSFAHRLQREFRRRTGLPCELAIHGQTEFPEPADRHNTEPVDREFPLWSESAAWDRLITGASF